MIVLAGGCHCGRIRARLATAHKSATLPLRADQCGFCRRHGARTAGGPDDELVLELDVPVVGYRFGEKIADFLICPRCGVYVAAVMGVGESFVGVVNTTVFDDPILAARTAEPVSYDGETAAERRARRIARWAPTRLDAALVRPAPEG